MGDIDLQRVQDALEVLEAEGRKCYKPQYQSEQPAYRAIGMAIAHTENHQANILELAYAALEDWNAHDLCALIEWAHPLFGQPFHNSDLERIARLVNRRAVTILAGWDPTSQEYRTRTVNVRLAVEDAQAEPARGSAAPDMLAALEDAEQYLALALHTSGEGDIVISAVLNHVRAAIAKGKGD